MPVNKRKTDIRISLWLLLLTSGILFSSCVKEDMYGDPGEGESAVIALNVASTRAADPADRTISSLRVLIFNSLSGNLVFNIPVPMIPTPGKPATLDILTGTYDFVFIANEDSDGALKAKLTSADDSEIDNIGKLRTLSFARAAFDDHKPIPMLTLIEDVTVLGDNTVKTPDMTAPVTDIWNVGMERVAIRLRMALTMSESLYARWADPKAVTIGGIAGAAYLLPEVDNSATQSGTGELFAAPDDPPVTDSDAGTVTVTYDRIILPELFLSSANNIADNSMLLSMDFGDSVKTASIKALDGYYLGYSLPRNTFLDMAVEVTEYCLTIDAEVLPWGDVSKDVLFDGQYTLKVEPAEYFFNSHAGSQRIGVSTDHPDGWSVEEPSTISWAASYPTMADNSFAVQEYPAGSAIRTGTFTIVAGNMRKTVHVTQFPSSSSITDAIIPDSYVGAFWRADQTGERLIRVPRPTDGTADGKWTAIVADGADWIHLDTMMTSDRNVGWRSGAIESAVANGNDKGFDDTYFVRGNLRMVTGTVNTADPEIYFRIGLNSAHTPTDDRPARYGVVLLSYGNNTKMQRIWIRQGEDADFLMRPNDPSGGEFVSPTRPAAVRFSPYNLTAKRLNVQIYLYGTNEYGATASKFADYPSQAGAYFQWANTAHPRYAWDPYNTATPAEWDETAFDGFWPDIESDYETCPEGYRRPNDGFTDHDGADTDLSLSEMRQSLFPDVRTGNLSNDNNSYGYYADGWFDRRKIGFDPSGLNANAAVSATDSGVAYIGQLLFNPSSYASLFFPASNSRNPDGVLVSSFYNLTPAGFYWTTSQASPGYGVGLAISNAPDPFNVTTFSSIFNQGLNIRCVRN